MKVACAGFPLALIATALLVFAWPAAGAPISVLTQFDGLANSDNTAASLPPDNGLAAGPNHLMEMVNSAGRIADKSGTAIRTFALQSFFGVDAGFGSSDPQAIYDTASGRWFATYVQFNASGTSSSAILAVSTGSDPTGAFCRYRLGNPTSESFLQDQPWLGVSDDKVGVSYNGFRGTLASIFLGAGYYVINKGDLVACAPSIGVVRVAPDPSKFSLRPAPSLSSTTTLYMVENDGEVLTLVSVDGVPGASPVTATSQTLPIRTWNPPPSAPQAGSTIPLDTGDERVLSVAWQNGSLWVAGNESCTPAGDAAVRSCMRFIEVRTDAGSVRQDMTFGDAGRYYYYPAVRPDASSNLLVVFTASSSAEFASLRVVGRLAGDPLNTLQPSQLLHSGGGAQTNASGRMGDYSGAAVDPSTPSNVWVSAEYIRSTASADWATSVAQLRFDVPGLAAAVLPSSRSVQVGSPATAFATLLVSGEAGTATGCGISPLTSVPGSFSYQTTDPATNHVTGSPNTPADIPAGGGQTFVIEFAPDAPLAATDVQLGFLCANTGQAPIISGVNTLLFSASETPAPDIVALAATVTNDGIVNIPAGGTGAFAVAAVNVGVGGAITVSADTGDAVLPVGLALCQTDPTTARCLSDVAASVTVPIDPGATPTFSVFVAGRGPVPFDPATNRIFVRFRDAGAITRGSTSVAARTQ